MKRYFFLIFLFLFSCSSGFYTCYDGPSCKQMVDRLMKRPGRINEIVDDALITTEDLRWWIKSHSFEFINAANKDFKRKYIIYFDTTVWFVRNEGKNEVRNKMYIVKIKNLDRTKKLLFYFHLSDGCFKLSSIAFGEPVIDGPLLFDE